MMQEGLKHFTEIPLMLFGMLLFFGTFLCIVGYTVWRSQQSDEMAELAAIPFLEGEQHEQR